MLFLFDFFFSSFFVFCFFITQLIQISRYRVILLKVTEGGGRVVFTFNTWLDYVL